MQDQTLEVWGDFACFSRPEMKVERFSYPLITPSAARGIFDAIYCKPAEFRWQVRRVEVLKPPAYIALRRNEVKENVSVSAVGRWVKGKAEPEPIFADVAGKEFYGDDMRGRTQRQTMALKDVRYRLHAIIRPWPGFEANLPAYDAQFQRRAAQGKCFCQPCFGCREFPAYFSLVQGANPAPLPADVNLEIGLMVYDLFDLSRPGGSEDGPFISLFRAVVRGGVLEVPEYESPDVLKGERRER